MDRLIVMRLAILLVLVALYLYAPAAWADEYRYSGNVVRVIDGGSLIIDVPTGRAHPEKSVN